MAGFGLAPEIEQAYQLRPMTYTNTIKRIAMAVRLVKGVRADGRVCPEGIQII
jgi:hypothetical protein